MSMMGHYARISLKELNELKRCPDSIMDFLDALEDDEHNERILDIEKSWHGIHFLLLGTPWGSKFSRSQQPLWNAVMGGTPLGSVNLGYGPVRFLTPKQVKETASALARNSETELRKRFDPRKFNENKIYPPPTPNGTPETEKIFLDYLIKYYVEIVAFFQAAARNGDALLLYVT